MLISSSQDDNHKMSNPKDADIARGDVMPSQSNVSGTEENLEQDKLRADEEGKRLYKRAHPLENQVRENYSFEQKRQKILNGKSLEIKQIESETNKKKIPGKVIEKLWEPLNDEGIESVDEILLVALNKTAERYYTPKSKKFNKKVTETQRILVKSWLDETNSRSFKSRLKFTKLPVPGTSLVSSKRGDIKGSLNFDQMSRRRTQLETYLLAEIKQLNDLKKYYNQVKLAYELDLRYFNDFKKIKTLNSSKMEKELQKRRSDLNFPLTGIETDRINLDTSQGLFTKFDPNGDKDVKEILSRLDTKLSSKLERAESLSKLNDKLEVLYNEIEMI